MKNITRKDLMLLTAIASTVSIISYNATTQEQQKRRTLNQEIQIIKNFFNEPKINTEKTSNTKKQEQQEKTRKITVKELKEKAFKNFL